MKSSTEIVDKLIEDLAFGDIESYMLTHIQAFGEGAQGWANEMRRMAQDMRKYLKEKDEGAKAELADSIAEELLNLRLVGILKNNPNSVKLLIEQRDFYKERLGIAVKDLQDRDQLIAGSAEQIRMLRAELAGKRATQ